MTVAELGEHRDCLSGNHVALVAALAAAGAHKKRGYRSIESMRENVGVLAAAALGNWRLARETDLEERRHVGKAGKP